MRWFTTLRAQFVAVMAVAVIFSNLAVIGIFEIGREGELRAARMEATVNRVAALFGYMANLPPAQQLHAATALGSVVFKYQVTKEPPFSNRDMTPEERKIAAELIADEEGDNKGLDEARIRLTEHVSAVDIENETPIVEIAQKLSDGRWLSVRWDRRPIPSTAPDLLIAAALGTILTGAAAAWLAGRVSRPLSGLAFAAGEVARGRAAPRLSVKGPEDIRLAVEAFNEMSARVARTLENQRQLLSAVGHDLRTPLAAMRITAEFVGDEDTRERLTRNLDELQALTEAVLSAARAGPGEEARRVDLAALIESVCEDLIDMALPVEIDIDGIAPCLCRPNEVRRAARNLIENAVRYGGVARVSLKAEGGSYCVTIEDNGPGIPEDKIDAVFEPFVRLETSRSSQTGGAGLGLTLARSIAREHDGDLTLENRRNGARMLGLRAVLHLPRGERTPKGNAPPQPAMAK